jgi:dTDP-4-amino-4,6-dideoxygalactose transaminase
MNGNNTIEFEQWLAKRNRVTHAITCHSGTQALEILASWTRTHYTATPTVLLPSFTFAATANAFIRNDWDVVFIDCDNQGILSPHKIPSSIDYQAVVLVGLYGAPVEHFVDQNMWKTWQLNRVHVIEDAAQHWLANGAVRIGESAAISFDPMKNLPCYGNGGAIVTNNWMLASYAKNWRSQGKDGAHTVTGTNSRMSEIDCAHLRIKTDYLNDWQDRRRKIAQHWYERLKEENIRVVINPRDIKSGHALHKFVLELDDRDAVREHLAARKIETKIHYEYPLHEVGLYRKYEGPGMLANSSSLSRRVLSLPFYPELTDLEVEYIIDSVIDCVSLMRS